MVIHFFLSHVVFEKIPKLLFFSDQELDVRWLLIHIILLKVKILDVLKNLCISFHPITSSRSQYDRKWIFFRFHIFNCGFVFGIIFSTWIIFWIPFILNLFDQINTWKLSSPENGHQYAFLAHTRYISWFSLRTQKFVLSMFSSISPITPNYPLPFRSLFSKKKTREGVVGEFFLLAQKIFAYGELEITPTKSAPAAGI